MSENKKLYYKKCKKDVVPITKSRRARAIIGLETRAPFKRWNKYCPDCNHHLTPGYNRCWYVYTLLAIIVVVILIATGIIPNFFV